MRRAELRFGVHALRERCDSSDQLARHRLVEVATAYHRGSQRFDRTLDDLFAIQDEIAASVAASLRGGVLSIREKEALARPQTGVAAYEYYLRGRQHLPLTQADLQKSGEIADCDSIRDDPRFENLMARLK